MRIQHCSDFHGNKAWFDWLAESSSDNDLVCLTEGHLPQRSSGRMVPEHPAVDVQAALRVCPWSQSGPLSVYYTHSPVVASGLLLRLYHLRLTVSA